MFDIWSLAHGDGERHLALGGHLALGAWHLTLGAWRLALDKMAFGARCLGSLESRLDGGGVPGNCREGGEEEATGEEAVIASGKRGESSDDREVLSNDALVAIICVSPETRHGRDASQR